MTEQELKTITQALLDGSTIQAMKDGLVPNWTDVETRSIEEMQEMLKFIIPNLFGYTFRVKPEVKTFKYKTRPYFCPTELGALGVWTNTGAVNEGEFEQRLRRQHGLFKWLAHATEHEVEYE